jgi:two-component system OmpR family response regulator
LVIEDDMIVSSAMEHHLAARGYEVACASTGEAGLHLAMSEYFDAITLDRTLPDMDGIRVVSALRQGSVSTPVLFVSGLSGIDERIAGIEAGGDDYLVKPFVPGEMLARLEALIRRAKYPYRCCPNN